MPRGVASVIETKLMNERRVSRRLWGEGTFKDGDRLGVFSSCAVPNPDGGEW